MGRINLSNRIKHGVIMLFVVLGLGFAAFAAPVAADEGGEGVREIRPPAEFGTDEVDMGDIVRKRFDAHGPIDFINEDRIVMGDVAYEIASGASISNISEGDYAGIQFNAWGQVVSAERLQGPPE